MSDEIEAEAERRFPLWLPTGDYEIDREDYSELDAKWQNEDTERDRAHFVQGAEWQAERDAVRIAELEAEVSRLSQAHDLIRGVAASRLDVQWCVEAMVDAAGTADGSRVVELEAEVARLRREFEWLHKKAGRTGSRLDAVVRAAHVPHGPEGVPEHVADAAYLREAAHKLEEHYKPFGSNLRGTVVGLLRAVAAVLDGGDET